MRQVFDRWYMLVFVAAAPLTMAANCNPTHQACRNDAGPTPIDCAEDELPSCINYCFPTVTEAEADGATCVVDPCDIELINEGAAILCPDNFACVPDSPSSRTGTCIQRTALTACEKDGSPPCPTGTFCRLFTSEFARPGFIDPSAEGMCMPWIREGALCLESGDPSAVECEPGTYCRPTAAGSWRCARPCESVDDCACASEGYEPQCIGEGSSAPTCSTCARLGQECDFGEDAPPCCGAAMCDDDADAVPGNERGLCCHPEEAECEIDEDCCGTNLCFEGQCTPCGGVGDPPTEAGCCRTLTVRGGVCSRECRWQGTRVYGNEPCTPTGAHASCQGKIVCTPAGAECRPNTISPDTDCDNVDDDCDGAIDDDYPGASCRDTPPGCPGGFMPATPGQKQCDYPNEPCYYGGPVRQSFCSRLGGVFQGPGNCFVGNLVPLGGCASDSDCSPAEACGPPPGAGCAGSSPGCCAQWIAGEEMFVPCCRQTGESLCWDPGARN